MDARKARGLAICEMGGQVEKVDDSHYRVKSQSTDAEYDVRASRSSWECTCWDYEIGCNCCKHVYAVGFSMSIADDDRPATVLEPARTDACPYCLSEDVRKKGFRKNGSGDLQRCQCRRCERRFSTNLGFENMHASPEMVTAAMHMHFEGASYRGVQKILKLHGAKVSHVAVYKWVDKYTKVMDAYLKAHEPHVGDK